MAEEKRYNDVGWLLTETDKCWDMIVARGGPDKYSSLVKRTIEERKWGPSVPLIRGNFKRVFDELGYVYVPKQMQPGPMFVFPIRSLDGMIRHCQSRPLPGSAEYAEKKKYMWLRPQEEKTSEPSWLGNDPGTIQRIIDYRFVVLVEGAFDLLAARLLEPDLPIMSSLTKALGSGHEKYLQILGVNKIWGLMDNEQQPAKGRIAAGKFSMQVMRDKITSMEFKILNCPSSDPSKALESPIKARQLQRLLHTLLPKTRPDSQ